MLPTKSPNEKSIDVLVVGGGPAGLSAALILGRCRRSVLVVDGGEERNRRSSQLNGFLTRDGIAPAEFLRLGREELGRYPTVEILPGLVRDLKKEGNSFHSFLHDGTFFSSRKVLLAIGVVDELPALPNIETYYGVSIFHCPYCDGWESRGKKIAVYGRGVEGVKLALALRTWSEQVTLYTDGEKTLEERSRTKLRRNEIPLVEEKILGFEGSGANLEAVVTTKEKRKQEVLFFKTHSYLRSELMQNIGLVFNHRTGPRRRRFDRTEISGLYAAGDICREGELVIVAAAEGARAAFSINTDLSREDLK